MPNRGYLPLILVGAAVLLFSMAAFVVKRSDFGMSGMQGALSDDVKVVVGLSGMKQ
jgi:hypothetical protein